MHLMAWARGSEQVMIGGWSLMVEWWTLNLDFFSV